MEDLAGWGLVDDFLEEALVEISIVYSLEEKMWMDMEELKMKVLSRNIAMVVDFELKVDFQFEEFQQQKQGLSGKLKAVVVVVELEEVGPVSGVNSIVAETEEEGEEEDGVTFENSEEVEEFLGHVDYMMNKTLLFAFEQDTLEEKSIAGKVEEVLGSAEREEENWPVVWEVIAEEEEEVEEEEELVVEMVDNIVEVEVVEEVEEV